MEISDWTPPIVPVFKNDSSVRICGDYKLTANQAVQEQKVMRTRLTEASSEKMCDLLLETGFDHSVSNVFRDNKVDDAVLVDLDKDDMKKLGISIAGQKELQQLIYKLKRSKRVTDFCILVGSILLIQLRTALQLSFFT